MIVNTRHEHFKSVILFYLGALKRDFDPVVRNDVWVYIAEEWKVEEVEKLIQLSVWSHKKILNFSNIFKWKMTNFDNVNSILIYLSHILYFA